MRYSLRRALSLDSVDGGTHNPTSRARLQIANRLRGHSVAWVLTERRAFLRAPEPTIPTDDHLKALRLLRLQHTLASVGSRMVLRDFTQPVASVGLQSLQNSEMRLDHDRALSAAFLPRVALLLNPMRRFASLGLSSWLYLGKNALNVD